MWLPMIDRIRTTLHGFVETEMDCIRFHPNKNFSLESMLKLNSFSIWIMTKCFEMQLFTRLTISQSY